MRTMLVAALLLATMLAGCGDEPADDDNPTTSNPGGGGLVNTGSPSRERTELYLLSSFGFDTCNGVRFQHLTTFDIAQSLLPAGYSPANIQVTEDPTGGAVGGVVPPESGQAANSTQQASLSMDMYQCSVFTAPPYEFREVWLGVAYVPIKAPAGADEHDAYGYIVDMAGGPDVLPAVWRIVGYPTHNGTAELAETPASRGVSIGDFVINITTNGPAALGAGGTFAWYREIPGGDLLLWTGSQTIPAGGSGGGSMQVPLSSGFSAANDNTGRPLTGQGAAIDGAIFTDMDLIRKYGAFRV